ncbi:MAG: hypothetical protein ACYCRD_08210 [Leptospirillum sp.]
MTFSKTRGPVFILLLILLLFGRWMGASVEEPALAGPSSLNVRILNVRNGQAVHGSGLSVRIRVTPSPTPQDPVFLRVLVNGRPHNLVKVTHRIQTVDIQNLPRGENRIEFIPADPDAPDLVGRAGTSQDASGLCDGDQGALPPLSTGVAIRVKAP